MIQLIYISTAERLMTADDLQSIMLTSLIHNSKKHVTGILLFDQGTFCQALEGEQRVVHELFKKIKNDPRHTNIIKIFDDEIQSRDFSSWSMRFINLNQYDRNKIDGYQEFNEAFQNQNFIKPIEAKKMLLHFR